MFRLNPINVVLYQIYLLQLEEYNLGRYFNVIFKTKGLPPPGPRRKPIDSTAKITLISLLSLGVAVLKAFIIAFVLYRFIHHQYYAFVASFFVLFLIYCYLFYFFLAFSTFITIPLDTFLKNRIISQAKEKLKQNPDIKVIGIAGSYGKTTMKELLYAVLKEKYNVLSTPKSINTPVGMSRIIASKLTPQTDIVIAEMGEYYKGDIKMMCEIATPAIGVITGINEAHFERLGNIQTTIDTIFELAQHMDPKGLLALNADDLLVEKHYVNYVTHQKVVRYSAHEQKQGEYEVKNITFHDNASGISFDLFQRGLLIGNFKIAVLGEYIIGDAIAAIKIAQELGLSIKQISDGLASMKPVEHRLQPIYNPHTKVLVIDDSYNGNPAGVEEAIKVLARFTQHRRIYLTPGLVEGGERSAAMHYNIGKALAPVAGLVLLIKNSVTPDIEKGLLENGFNKEHIVWFNSSLEAHKGLGKLLRPYDVILFQNDWPDNYL